MAYHIYTTEGVVMKRTNFGEANIILYILTSDLGLIIASAQSARLSVSKLRPSLQEYSFSNFSLVKGKNGWKLTNAISINNFYFESQPIAQKFISQISSILVRMMPGEEVHQEIFEMILTCFRQVKKIDLSKIYDLEILCMLRVLYLLGYVSKDGLIDKFLIQMNDWSDELLAEIKDSKQNLLLKINTGLKESQL